ncbi:MAG TPA: hypothetical protein VGG38_18715 [Acidimicrobiales bacterium]|jgi:hypothetical protein
MAERTVQDTLDALEPLVGRWPMAMDGSNWSIDFGLTYNRVE